MSKLYNQLQPVVSRLDNKINNVKEQLQDIRQELADIESDWGSSIIDDTLSIKGAAADAKAVGDYHMTNVQAADLLTMGMPIGDNSSILYNQLKPVVSQLDNRINNINNQIEYLNEYVDNQVSSDVTDWLEENITETGSAIMVDASLSIQGAAADAKKTGERLEDLETVIVRFDDTVVSPDITFILATDTYPLGWKVGSYASDTGAAGNSTRYIRTITGGSAELVAPDRANKVYAKAPSSRYISIYEYTAEGVYIGRHGVPNNASGTGTNEVEADATQGHIYKLCIGFTEAGVDASTWLTEEFIGQIQFFFTIRGGVEKIERRFDNDPKDFSNYTILCAKERNYTDGTPTTIDWYLVCDTDGTVYMTKDFKTGKRMFVAEDPWLHKFGVMLNGDIISVYRTEFHSTRTSTDYRKNPHVWLASEDWKICHTVDFGTDLKPSGWLENCGFCSMPNGEAMFTEYTRPSVTTVNCWKISGDVTNPLSWKVVKSFEQSGSATEGLEHMHYVIYDFLAGVYYLSTGDDDSGSQLWYSRDNGETWALARQPSEKYCRALNLIFTENYIYWASDSSARVNHYLFRCERDENGVIDFNTVIELTSLYITGVATYGTAYLPELNALVLLDYCDSVNTEMPFRIYSIDENKVYTMGTLQSADGESRHIGFRTEYSEWYPSGNYVLCGFGKRLRLGDYKNYIKGVGNAGDYNGYFENVNNLRVGIYRTPNGYGYRLGTAFAYFANSAGAETVGNASEKIEELNGRLTELEQGGTGGGLTADVKAALLACFNHVVWDSADPTGQSYINALQTALYPPANLSQITAVYTQPGTVYDTATLNSLKANLVVTAHYSDSTTETVTNYTLSGTLAEGTSTITVSYGGKTATFTVTVTEYEPVTETISWSGSGVDKTSSLIDATQMTAYLTIPFESEASQLVEGATAESQGMKIRTWVYSDSAAQNLVGYYYIDTNEIEATGRTTANSPWCLFDTEMVAVPQGYYGTIKISRQGTNVFVDNSSCGTYLNAYATSVEMR